MSEIITIPNDTSDHQPNFTKDKWGNYMKEKIKHVNAPVSNKSWMILKPPEALLEVKPKAYNPKVVTIGPLYQNLEASPINNFKALCVKKFMERIGISAVEDLIQYLMFGQPHELRHIYNLNLPQSEFEWLQLLVTIDTVFIHEFLLLTVPPEDTDTIKHFTTLLSNDYTLGTRIERDLLLIGNQIPMSFLKKIAEFSLAALEEAVRAFIIHSNPFFSCRVLRFLESKEIKLVDTCEHLLDSLYYLCTVGEEQVQSTSSPCLNKSEACQETKTLETHKTEFPRLPTASQLSKAGISFKACEGNVSVMKYEKRKLQLHLPRLIVYDGTEDVLRNILAHEITSANGDEFLAYTHIMDMLIDTEEDLAILAKAKVIENHTGNDIRVVKMWNDMCINISYRSESKIWNAVVPNVVAHYSSRWRGLYAECYEKFFSRPWLWISVIAAFLLLLASLSQTCYAILEFYKP